MAKLDLNRARHEIPLYDTVTGEVRYGLDALFLILGDRMPIFKPLFRSAVFRAPLHQLYQIITFNRRIIAASVSPKNGFDCTPDMNIFYRWVYFVLAVAAAIWLLFPDALAVGWSGWHLLGLHGIALVVGVFSGKKLDYMGQWATIFLVNGLLAWLFPNIWLTYVLLLLLTGWMWRKRWPISM